MSTEIISRQKLQEVPGKTLQLLSGIGTAGFIRVLMARAGYSEEEHLLGWSLLHAVTGFHVKFSTSSSDDSVRAATAEIDAWDEPMFRRGKSALSRLHPEQAQFLYANLEPASGAASVLGVETFLNRCDALESSPEREGTRAADHAALATIASRGVTLEERKRMRMLCDIAKKGSIPTENESDKELTADLMRLHAWYSDWAETARTVLGRRDHLIRLGLSKRKKARKVDVEAVPPTQPAPGPVTFPGPGPAVTPQPPVTAPVGNGSPTNGPPPSFPFSPI